MDKMQGVISTIQFPLGQDELAVTQSINCLLKEGWTFLRLGKDFISLRRTWEVDMGVELMDGTAGEKGKIDKNRKPTRRKYRRRAKEEAVAEDGITKQQFIQAKKKVVNAKQNKGINENQEAALTAIKGLHFKKISEVQKQQVLNIANDL